MKLQDVKCIGVLGAGVMGAGISQTAISAGFKVIARDLNDEIIARAREGIIDGRFGLKRDVERGKITLERMDKALANLTLTTKVEDLKNCDVVIETIGGGPSGELENKEITIEKMARIIDEFLRLSVQEKNSKELENFLKKYEHFKSHHFAFFSGSSSHY